MKFLHFYSNNENYNYYNRGHIKLSLRAFRCRFDLGLFSVTLCKYRSNNTFEPKNELPSASRSRARIWLNLNFKSTHSLSKLTKSDDFTTILSQIKISTNFRIRKYQKYFWNDRSVKMNTKLWMNAETTVFKINLKDGYHMKSYEIKNTFPHSNFWIWLTGRLKLKTRCWPYFTYDT